LPFILHQFAGQESLISFVPGAALRIGRGTNADLRLGDLTVALEHAVIQRERGGYRLIDRGGVTGTYLNGKPVREALLAPNDLIDIGGFQIRVQITDPDDPLFLTVHAGAAGRPAPLPRALTVDYLRAFGLQRLFFNKTLLSAALALGAAAILLSLPLTGRTTAFEPGSVHRWHAETTTCASCHAPWRGPDPALCADCHATQREKGEVHQARQAFTPPCTGCHPEHRGGDRLAAVDDRNCSVCHADLRVNAGEPRFARSAGSFAGGQHPDFSVTLPGGARLPLAEAVARRADPTSLRFNHQRHLRAALPTPSGRRVQLDCASCHALSAGGAGGGTTGIVPVTYRDGCTSSGCHPLTFDDRRPDLVAPHAAPQRVREFLVSVYSDRRGGDQPVRDQYRQLIRGQGAAPRGLDFSAQAQGRVVLAERYLYLTACKECHIVDAGARALPRVIWTPSPERWLPHARFSHLDHEASACLDCHAAAAASAVAADVLLPSVAVCRRCHGGGVAAEALPAAARAPARRERPAASAPPPRAAGADCLSCHVYHPAPPPETRRGALVLPTGNTVSYPGRRASGQPLVGGEAEEVEPAMRSQLGVDVAKVRLDGAFAGPQLRGDATVAQAASDHPDDLDLAGRQQAHDVAMGALVVHQLLDHPRRRSAFEPGLTRVNRADAVEQRARRHLLEDHAADSQP